MVKYDPKRKYDCTVFLVNKDEEACAREHAMPADREIPNYPKRTSPTGIWEMIIPLGWTMEAAIAKIKEIKSATVLDSTESALLCRVDDQLCADFRPPARDNPTPAPDWFRREVAAKFGTEKIHMSPCMPDEPQ